MVFNSGVVPLLVFMLQMTNIFGPSRYMTLYLHYIGKHYFQTHAVNYIYNYVAKNL